MIALSPSPHEMMPSALSVGIPMPLRTLWDTPQTYPEACPPDDSKATKRTMKVSLCHDQA